MSLNFKINNDRQIIVTLKQHAMWIKELMKQISSISGDIKIELPFTYDDDTGQVVFNNSSDIIFDNGGNVEYNNDIIIQNDIVSINSLSQYLKDLATEIEFVKKLISTVDDTNDVAELVKVLSYTHERVIGLSDDLFGFVRKAEESKTTVNDELEIVRGITFTSEQAVNASFVGFGGQMSIHVDSNNVPGLACVGTNSETGKTKLAKFVYTDGFDEIFTPQTLWLLSLSGGQVDGSNLIFKRVSTYISFAKYKTSSDISWSLTLDVMGGTATVTNTGIELTFNLGSNTKLHHPSITFVNSVDSLTYVVREETYYLNAANVRISFTSNDIRWDGNNLVADSEPKFDIVTDKNSFDVFNPKTELTKFSTITIVDGSYLNGFKPSGSSVPVEIENDFKTKYNIAGAVSYGSNIQNKSTASDGAGITFTGAQGNVNIYYQDIKTTESGDKKRGLYIDSDLRIKYGDNPGEEITISELYGTLLNRIITLERANAFTTSIYTTETIVQPDNVADATVTEYYADAKHVGQFKPYPSN